MQLLLYVLMGPINLIKFFYKYSKRETLTDAFLISATFNGCVWRHELWNTPSPEEVYVLFFVSDSKW